MHASQYNGILYYSFFLQYIYVTDNGDAPQQAQSNGDVLKQAQSNGDVPHQAHACGDIPHRAQSRGEFHHQEISIEEIEVIRTCQLVL